jgi:hypothetical protein
LEAIWKRFFETFWKRFGSILNTFWIHFDAFFESVLNTFFFGSVLNTFEYTLTRFLEAFWIHFFGSVLTTNDDNYLDLNTLWKRYDYKMTTKWLQNECILEAIGRETTAFWIHYGSAGSEMNTFWKRWKRIFLLVTVVVGTVREFW